MNLPVRILHTPVFFAPCIMRYTPRVQGQLLLDGTMGRIGPMGRMIMGQWDTIDLIAKAFLGPKKRKGSEKPTKFLDLSRRFRGKNDFCRLSF